MTTLLDETHDPSLVSWVESANDPLSDFPIQNLPFGRFRRAGETSWNIGVAIGDRVLDLHHAGLIDTDELTVLMQAEPGARQKLRRDISSSLGTNSRQRKELASCLSPQASVQMALPCHIGDYTDFYVGIHHATAVGRLFRPDDPLLPNYKWVPIGYHGRASTIDVTGHRFPRPRGQLRGGNDEAPHLAATDRLDYELEIGVFIGRPNVQGRPITIDEAEDHAFGITLLNDWSARDIQAWEYQPLGPFLSKNFATTISPWIVTMDALAPFRQPYLRPASDPQPLPYLDSEANRAHGAMDIALEIRLQTAAMRSAGQSFERISRSNFAGAAYWTVAQLIAHHTVNGCSLQSGDLFGSGTLSGLLPEEAGSLLELTHAGTRPITLANGEQRRFLLDGDAVTVVGHCERPGFRRIGFGACTATIDPPTR